MFRLSKEFQFEASHRLDGHDGKCANLHGHTWRLIVEIAGEELIEVGPKAGMLMDYSDLKAIVQPIVEESLDHRHLNVTLATNRPTSEFVARWAYQQLKPRLSNLTAVTICETCTTACRYEE